MAFEQPFKNITLVTAADLSAKQYYAVKVDSNGKAALAGAGERAIGVLQEPETAGRPVPVMTEGVSFGVLGATVAAGAEVEVDAAGKFVTLSAGKAVGICLVGGAADDIGSIYVK